MTTRSTTRAVTRSTTRGTTSTIDTISEPVLPDFFTADDTTQTVDTTLFTVDAA